MRHAQGESADTGGELTRLVAIAIALALLGAFVVLGLQLLGHLCLQHLIQDGFEQVGELTIAAREEALQDRRIKGKLVWGHGCPLWLGGGLPTTSLPERRRPL